MTETTIQKDGPDGLNQGQMLRLILRNLLRRNQRTMPITIFMFLLWFNFAFLAIGMVSRRTSEASLLFQLFALPFCIAQFPLTVLRPGPRSALSAYLALPLSRHTLASGILAASTGLYLLMASLLYGCLVVSGISGGLPLAVFLALLIIGLSALIGSRSLPAWMMHRDFRCPYWIANAVQSGVGLVWIAVSITFLFRIASRTHDRSGAAYGSATRRISDVLLSSDTPFVWPNLLFLWIAAVVLVLSLTHAETVIHEVRRKPCGTNRRDSRPAYGTKRRRSIWRLQSIIAAPLGRMGPTILFLGLILGLAGITTDHTPPFNLFLSMAAFLVYCVSLDHALRHLRALRSLPVRSGTLSVGILMRPAFLVGLLACVALFAVHWMHRPISGPYFLLSIAAGCVLAHLATLLAGLGVRGGYIGVFVLIAFALFAAFGSQGNSTAANAESLAWIWVTACTALPLIGGVWALAALIDRSSGAYRNREKEVS